MTIRKCRKIMYKTRGKAKKAMKEWNKTRPDKMTDVYYCDQCLSHHLTSMPKESSRNFRRYLKNKKNKQ